jgi:phosphoglycerate dehydrogenase-like enzyme
MLNILYPDAQFDGEADIETAALGAEAELHVFRARAAADVPARLWQDCDAIVCYHDVEIDAALVGRLERCRLIVRAGVGFDQVDIAACAARGIPVCNTPDYGTTDVADHSIAMMLALARGVVSFNEELKRSTEAGWDFLAAPTVRRLAGQTFGVVGLGRIGTATALRAKAFGMNVVFYDPYRPSGAELALGIGRAGSLEALLAQSQVVSLHAPLTPETRGLIGDAALAQMRADALLVNTARGPLVDPQALLRALLAGRIAGAALDVLPVEPPAADDPLLAAWRENPPALRGRLILSPHAAFYSAASLRDLREKSAAVAADYLFHGKMRNCVNDDGTPRRWR